MKRFSFALLMSLIFSSLQVGSASAYDFELDFDSKNGRAQYVSPKEDANLPSSSDRGLIKAYNLTGGYQDYLGKGNSVVQDD